MDALGYIVWSCVVFGASVLVSIWIHKRVVYVQRIY